MDNKRIANEEEAVKLATQVFKAQLMSRKANQTIKISTDYESKVEKV